MFVFVLVLAAESAINGSPVYDEMHKLHPVESYCIDYTERGTFRGEGWTKICSRNFGAETFSVSYSVGEGGNGLTGEKWNTLCHLHTIEVGDKVYTIDLVGDAAIMQQNSQLGLKRASAAAYAAEKTLDAYVAPYGYTPTGETDTVAGVPCFEYEHENGAAKACYSKDLLLLRSMFSTGFASHELVATSVSIGETGGDENYRLYESRSILELGPNEFYNFICSRIPDETE